MTRMLLSREKVYDPILRSIHAWNGVAILLLVLTAQVAAWLEFTPEASALWRFHVWAGYALVVGLVARLVWGVHGPRHASWSAMWQRGAWWHAVKTWQWFAEPKAYGHHPLASVVYILFYLIILVMAVTGLSLAAIEQGAGPMVQWLGHDLPLKVRFQWPHDFLEEFVMGFVVLHIAALILHESRHGVPMAQAMVSGYQYRKEE